MDPEHEKIRQLLKEGRNREAAELLVARGELGRAMEAYAAVWEYDRAAEVALDAGDLPHAMDFLLRSGDREGAAEVRRELATGPVAETETTVRLLLDRGEKDEAARLLEARGELERAAELLRESGEIRRAARLLERCGEHREAGRLYERLLSEQPDDAHAALALGTILERFGRHEPAARMLQVAARDGALKRPALRGLVAALDAMGLGDAAGAALEELLAVDASAPRTVEALVTTAAAEDREAGEEQWLGGRYQVIKLLGGGAAGRVYLARDALYDREVALKVLSTSTGGGRDAFARFVREANVAARLEHPNIVRLLDFDEGSGLMAMEYLSAGTLADKIVSGPLPLDAFEETLLAMLGALEAAHLRSVVHRDVKPQNVLFGRAGEVKLGDFGVAHLQDLGLTQTGAFIGTLTYMAPEQITGDKVTASTDLYGLGTTLFHALCGRPPFVGADLVRQHLAEPPPRPSEVRPALGDRFDGLFERLLEKVPSERFETAADVRRAAKGLDFAEPTGERESFAPAPEPIRTEAARTEVELLEPPRPIPGGILSLARDESLDLRIELRRIEAPDHRAAYAALGRAPSPHLQQVLDVDEESLTVTLASPEGQLLSARLGGSDGLEPMEALTVADEVAAALEALHAAGGAHGHVTPERVRLCRHRTVLLLPEEPPDEEAARRDAEGVLEVLGAALRAPARWRALIESERLASLLGESRSARLLAELSAAPDLGAARHAIAAIRRAVEDRALAREHLHALAATARAAGTDPKTGPIAEFLDRRRRELDA